MSPWIVIASHNLKSILDLQMRGMKHVGEGLVIVYYNPNRPARSYLIQPSLTGIALINLGAVSPLGFYLHHYH